MCIDLPSGNRLDCVFDPAFSNNFKQAVLACIDQSEEAMVEKQVAVDKVRAFAEDLFDSGFAEVKGTDLECRSICVTVQGGIELALAKMLQEGALRCVHATFLTPLPTTPLRKKGDTKELASSEFDPARQYTLDMRENTVRALRDAGGILAVGYSKEAYEALKNDTSDASKEQVANWEAERLQSCVIDYPLDTAIPKDLIGAVYMITDASGQAYFLPTQGIQAKDAAEGEATWKKWFSLTSYQGEGTVRANAMLRALGSLD